MTDLERSIRLSAQAVANIDRGESAWRLIIARDRLLYTMSAEEQRLFRMWARQERPS